MINWHLSGQALEHCLRLSGARTVISDSEGIENVRQIIEGEFSMEIVLLGEERRVVIESNPEVEMPGEDHRKNVRADSPLALFYTSGTTGHPKAVHFVHSRPRVSAYFRRSSYAQCSGPGGDRWYICLPLYHGTGAINSIQCLMNGVSIAIAPGFSVRTFWNDVRESESTCFVYVGEVARYLLADAEAKGRTGKEKEHKLVCMHGNGLRPDVWGKFQDKFGVQEVSEFFASTEGVYGMENWDRSGWARGAVGCHGAIRRWLMRESYVLIKVDHETNEVARDEETGLVIRRKYEESGELLVKVDSEDAFSGYVGAPEATKKKFVRDVLNKGDLYYRTGDALRWVFSEIL